MSAADRLSDRWLRSAPLYMSDLHRCGPSDALSSTPELRRWRMVPYQTDSFSGTMLLAGPETAAPDLTYPLNAAGWHAVSLGMYADTPGDVRQIGVKLSGDDTLTYVTVRPDEAVFQSQRITERFWRIADLSGQDLQFSQVAARVGDGGEPGSFVCHPAYLAYVKLVPLTDAEVAEVRADRARSDARRVFVHNDAHGYIWHLGVWSEEEIRREIEPFRDTDVARVYWETGQGDLTYYHSRIGRLPTVDGVSDFVRVGDRLHAETWRRLRDSGLDPLAVAAEHAREIGVELHAAYRVAGFQYPPPLYDAWNAGGFAVNHPELACLDRAGNPTPRISYAYPQTRAFVVSLLSEMAAYPVDGIALLYNRRPPLLEYETPLVESFIAEFGQDPREIDPGDPRWLAHRAGFLTRFMRELRAALDEVGRARNLPKRLQVSAVVMGGEAENMLNGMDLRAWVNEGLVDTLIPYTSGADLDSGVDAWADAEAIAYFVDLVRGSPCLLAPNLMPRLVPPETLRRRAAGLYAAGVDHLFAWDCDASGGRPRFDDYWDVFRRLGHRGEVAAWTQSGEPDVPATTMPLRVLGDWDLAYATPG